MDWREHIHSDPEILRGKPVVKGTRLSVDFILGLFAAGWTEKQVLENYPLLTPEKLRAVLAFAAGGIRKKVSPREGRRMKLDLKEQYIVDRQGLKVAVILPLAQYEQLLEDLHDLAVVAERREEETISLDEVEKRLKENGLL